MPAGRNNDSCVDSHGLLLLKFWNGVDSVLIDFAMRSHTLSPTFSRQLPWDGFGKGFWSLWYVFYHSGF